MSSIAGGIKAALQVVETIFSYPRATEFGAISFQRNLAASFPEALHTKASDQAIDDGNQSEKYLVTSSQEKAESVGNIG